MHTMKIAIRGYSTRHRKLCFGDTLCHRTSQMGYKVHLSAPILHQPGLQYHLARVIQSRLDSSTRSGASYCMALRRGCNEKGTPLEDWYVRIFRPAPRSNIFPATQALKCEVVIHCFVCVYIPALPASELPVSRDSPSQQI